MECLNCGVCEVEKVNSFGENEKGTIYQCKNCGCNFHTYNDGEDLKEGYPT